VINDDEKVFDKLKADNAAFLAAIAHLPNPYTKMGERERRAHEAFHAGDDMEVVRIMAEPVKDKSVLSPEDRAYLVVMRWFDEHDAGYNKWWNRLKLWKHREGLMAAIAEEIRRAEPGRAAKANSE
jgi:hypothetical protein